MKKLILLFALSAFISIAKAQSPVVPMNDADALADTVVNTATVNLDYQFTGDYNLITFNLVTTKISGTVAGTCPLQASVDGVNFYPINTTNYRGIDYADTCTVTNVATFVYTWTERPARYRYYRLAVTGSGTSAYIVKGWAQPRKVD